MVDVVEVLLVHVPVDQRLGLKAALDLGPAGAKKKERKEDRVLLKRGQVRMSS